MKKFDKLLKFMSEYEGNGEYKTFDFYSIEGLHKYVDGKNLNDLKKYIKEFNDNKIKQLLQNAFDKEYICQIHTKLNTFHDDYKLTNIGQKYLEEITKNKFENFKWAITTLIAVIGLIISVLNYYFPNETKIQTIVKTELKNTNNINIK